MTRTDPSNGALNRSAGLWHTPASAASLGPAMRPTHYGEVSAFLLIFALELSLAELLGGRREEAEPRSSTRDAQEGTERRWWEFWR